jgi:hypothetical protein
MSARTGGRFTTCPDLRFENLPKGTVGATAEAPYAMWVDQMDTLGFGKNTPIATASQSDALEALVDGNWVVMRVPYPMSYYAKGMDGRIDDRDHGVEGQRASTRPIPNARRRTSKAARARRARSCTSQLRPDPLAH